MATATARACITLTIGSGSSAVEYQIHEGDIVNDLVYTNNGVSNTVSGAVRVINATVNRVTITQSCPPESYFDRLVTIESMIIDKSSVYDADLVTVYVSQITDLGSVVTDFTTLPGGSTIASALANLKTGETLLIPEGSYTEDLKISSAVTLLGQGEVTINGTATINVKEGETVSIQNIAFVNEALAGNSAVIDVTSGDVELIGVSVDATCTADEASCVRKDAVAAGVSSTVTIKDCNLAITQPAKGNYSYGIALGRYDTSAAIGTYDMGDVILSIENSTIEAPKYSIYSVNRGVDTITISNSTLSAWAGLYMTRNGETETKGTFADEFAGSTISITDTIINGTQPFLASTGSTESNEFAAIAIQNTQNVTLAVANSSINVANDHTGVDEGSTFAPMYAIACYETTKNSTVSITDGIVTIESPRVDKAIIVEEGASISALDTTLNFVDWNGASIEDDCTLI